MREAKLSCLPAIEHIQVDPFMPVFSDLWKEEEAGKEGKFEAVEPEPKTNLNSENEKGSKISSKLSSS